MISSGRGGKRSRRSCATRNANKNDIKIRRTSSTLKSARACHRTPTTRGSAGTSATARAAIWRETQRQTTATRPSGSKTVPTSPSRASPPRSPRVAGGPDPAAPQASHATRHSRPAAPIRPTARVRARRRPTQKAPGGPAAAAPGALCGGSRRVARRGPGAGGPGSAAAVPAARPDWERAMRTRRAEGRGGGSPTGPAAATRAGVLGIWRGESGAVRLGAGAAARLSTGRGARGGVRGRRTGRSVRHEKKKRQNQCAGGGCRRGCGRRVGAARGQRRKDCAEVERGKECAWRAEDAR